MGDRCTQESAELSPFLESERLRSGNSTNCDCKVYFDDGGIKKVNDVLLSVTAAGRCLYCTGTQTNCSSDNSTCIQTCEPSNREQFDNKNNRTKDKTVKTRRCKLIWKILGIVLIVILLITIACLVTYLVSKEHGYTQSGESLKESSVGGTVTNYPYETTRDSTRIPFDGGLQPIFDTKTINKTVIAGDNASLECSVTAKGMYVVGWMNARMAVLTADNSSITEDRRITVERPSISDWNLQIRDVRYEDRGEYTCFINTRPQKKKKVYLDVKVPPRIISIKPARRTTVREGDKVELVCNATGVPSPTITWIRHRRNLHGEVDLNEAISSPGEHLLIHNISRYYEGTYECRADNGILKAVSAQIEVDVVFPPEVTVTNKRLGQFRGRETLLECTISASPFEISGWKRNGKEIKRRGKYRIYKVEQHIHTVLLDLYISNLNSEDYGQYSCFAQNMYGRGQDSTFLYESIISTSTRRTTTAKQIRTKGASGFSNSSERLPRGNVTLLNCLIFFISTYYYYILFS